MTQVADVIVSGAGLVGVATAYHLAQKLPASRIVLVDPHPPLWKLAAQNPAVFYHGLPGQDNRLGAWIADGDRQLTAMADHGSNPAKLRHSGVLVVGQAGSWSQPIEAWLSQNDTIRHHPGPEPYLPVLPATAGSPHALPAGADRLSAELIKRYFPYLASDSDAIHLRQAGTFDPLALGSWLLDHALARGIQLRRDQVNGFDPTGGKVKRLFMASGRHVDAPIVILTEEMPLQLMTRWLGIDLPWRMNRVIRLCLPRRHPLLPQLMPVLWWGQKLKIPWTPITWSRLPADARVSDWLKPLPPHLQLVPGAKESLHISWELSAAIVDPWQETPDHMGRVLLAAASRLAPELPQFLLLPKTGQLSTTSIWRTPDNMPLIGPLPLEGAYICGCLAKNGLMTSLATGALLAACLAGDMLPSYAATFNPLRLWSSATNGTGQQR